MKKSITKLDHLEAFQEVLDEELTSGKIDVPEYEAQWDTILSSFGWTREDYEREVDRRWDYINVVRPGRRSVS